MTLVLVKGGMGRGMGWGGGRRELDGNCDGEEVFENLLYCEPLPHSLCVWLCVFWESKLLFQLCVN